LVEHALVPVFNFFCKKETGDQLSDVINLYLVYMYENIISQKSDFKNHTLKDLVSGFISKMCVLLYYTSYLGQRFVFVNNLYAIFLLIITLI